MLRMRGVMARTGLSRSTVYRLEAAGQFPPRIKLGESASAWLESEVTAWLRQKVEASRQAGTNGYRMATREERAE